MTSCPGSYSEWCYHDLLGHYYDWRYHDMFLQICRRRFLGHLCGRDWTGGAVQLAGGWWPWPRPCRCQCRTMTSASTTPCALLFRPPCRLGQELRCVRAPLPRPADDARLLMILLVFSVVVLPHGGKSFISRFVSSVDPCVICSLVLLLTTRAN
jgi:hypothetical protein